MCNSNVDADVRGDCKRGGDPGSAFILFARHCRKNYLEHGDLGRLVRNAAKTSLFCLRPTSGVKMQRLLGLDSAQWLLAQGSDLLFDSRPKMVLATFLRYCPLCLEEGWHTATFQHPAVHRCPLHEVTLVNGCTRCGARVDTCASSLVENHLYCGSCGKRLGDAKAVPHPKSESFLDLREALSMRGLADTDCSIRHRRPASPADDTLAVPGIVNQTSLHCQRGWHPVAGLRYFKPSIYRLPPLPTEKTMPDARMLEYEMVKFTLREIARWLEEEGALTPAPEGLSAHIRLGRPVNLEISLPTAALWATSAMFDMPADVVGESAEGGCWPRWWPGWSNPMAEMFPLCEEAIPLIGRAVVHNAFVAQLLAIRGIEDTIDVSWKFSPTPGAVAPAWRIRSESAFIEVELRSRTDEERLRRLARRYRLYKLATVDPERMATVRDPLAELIRALNRRPALF